VEIAHTSVEFTLPYFPLHVFALSNNSSRDLAMIKEAEGDVNAACDIMLEVYVETFGALSKREKIDFILEQIRLCIAKVRKTNRMLNAHTFKTNS